jgi:alpha 1,3-glucosidase
MSSSRPQFVFCSSLTDNVTQPYYDYFTHEVYQFPGNRVKVSAPLEKLPLLQQGGTILPRRDLIRRSAVLMWRDPITLVVAPDSSGQAASGQLYLDDGDTFAYEKGEFVWRGFELSAAGGSPSGLKLRNFDHFSIDKVPAHLAKGLANYDATSNAWATKIADVTVDEVVVLGLPSKPSCVRLGEASTGLKFEWRDGVPAAAARRKSGKKASELIVKGISAHVVKDWELHFEFGPSECTSREGGKDILETLQSPECPSGQFFCRNPGHIPSCILSSRVNDGLCEPECCDGSDEFDGKVSCPNICKRVNAEYKKRVDEEGRVNRVGGSLRREYAKFGEMEKTRITANIDRISNELVGVEEKTERLKELLERTESRKADEIELKKASSLYATLLKHQAAIGALRAERALLDENLEHLSQILADLKAGFNPNYQVRCCCCYIPT